MTNFDDPNNLNFPGNLIRCDHTVFENYRKTCLPPYNYDLNDSQLYDLIVTNHKGKHICKAYILMEDSESYIVQLLVPLQINKGRGCTSPTRYYRFMKDGDIQCYDYNVHMLKEPLYVAKSFKDYSLFRKWCFAKDTNVSANNTDNMNSTIELAKQSEYNIVVDI
jgi:hypothetical protein